MVARSAQKPWSRVPLDSWAARRGRLHPVEDRMDPGRGEDRRRHSKKKHTKERDPTTSSRLSADEALPTPPTSARSLQPPSPPPTIVKLNIGGHHYVTTASTLLASGESYFTSMLSGRIPTTKDDAGTCCSCTSS